MSDRRLTPFSGRVALAAWRGRVDAAEYVEGTAACITAGVTDLCPTPDALRDRQLVFGARVTCIDQRDGWTFVQAADEYCGWVQTTTLGEAVDATHVVCTPATHVYRHPSIKQGEGARLTLGSRLAVLDHDDQFARIAQGWVPKTHVRAVGDIGNDPAAEAEKLLGTPYLWGGNSRDGIDCSGLVQVALAMCGVAAPADSDLQRAAFGAFLPADDPIRRGDLFFWQGHIAMALDGETLIHANGHSMNVARENIQTCLARIAPEIRFFGRKRP